MSKNLKLSFILLLVFASIVIAWWTLISFFGGVGLNFVALIAIISVLLILMLNDNFVTSRIKDMFILACVFAVLELIFFCVIEFGYDISNVIRGFKIYQSIVSVLGILFFIYIIFRFITEIKGVKVSFVETILGNNKRTKKIKTAKELSNGSLEEKPNKKHSAEKNDEQNEENIIINDDLDQEE